MIKNELTFYVAFRDTKLKEAHKIMRGLNPDSPAFTRIISLKILAGTGPLTVAEKTRISFDNYNFEDIFHFNQRALPIVDGIPDDRGKKNKFSYVTF